MVFPPPPPPLLASFAVDDAANPTESSSCLSIHAALAARAARFHSDDGDGPVGCKEATGRRAASAGDGERRGRAASSVAVGAAVLLFFCSDKFFDHHAGGGLPCQFTFYPTQRVYLARNSY